MKREYKEESWSDVLRMIGLVLFIAGVIWAMHIKLFAERAQAHERPSPMLMCDVGC